MSTSTVIIRAVIVIPIIWAIIGLIDALPHRNQVACSCGSGTISSPISSRR